jgi:AcrR family transcriptional regulator
MPRYKTSESEQIAIDTRQKLLDSAAEEFAHQGFTAANINRISQAAGYAKGTIYNYFASKEAILLDLIETAAAEHIAFIAAAVSEVSSPQERLLHFFQAGFAYVEAHPSPMQVIVHTLYGADEAHKAHLAQVYQPLFAVMMNDILEPGMQDNSFRRMDVGRTATFLLTTYLGICIPQDIEGRTFFDPQMVTSLLLNGIKNDEKEKVP